LEASGAYSARAVFVAGLFSVLFAGLVRSSVCSYPILLAALLGLYVVVDASHGSGALAVLIFALLMGNFGLRLPTDGSALTGSLDPSTRLFHSQVTFFIKALFFTFMGAMLGRPSSQMAVGIGLGILLVVARVFAVRLALVRSPLDPAVRGVITTLVPRGLAAVVLATFPVTAGLPASSAIPEIVNAAVITTIVAFAVALPYARHKLDEERGPSSWRTIRPPARSWRRRADQARLGPRLVARRDAGWALAEAVGGRPRAYVHGVC
jgi:cell volume regulation protein A